MGIQLMDGNIGDGQSTDPIKLIGNCDVIIHGMTQGSVNLEYKLKPTENLPDPGWIKHPEGSFIEDTFKTVFVSDFGNEYRLTGEGNNIVYVRLSYFLNG